MKNKDTDIEKILREQKIPKPSEGKREETLNMALSAFKEGQNKKTKGFNEDTRLINENKIISFIKGGFPMKKPVLAFASALVVSTLLLSVFIMNKSEYKQVTPVVGVDSVEPTTPEKLVKVKPESRKDVTDSKKAISKKPTIKRPATKPKEQLASIEVQEPAPKGNETKQDHLGSSTSIPLKEEMVMSDATEMEAGSYNAPSIEKQVNRKMSRKMVQTRRSMDYATSGVVAYESDSIRGAHQPPPSYREPFDPYGRHIPQYEEGRDKFDHQAENSIKLTSREPVSTFSIDVDTASYSFVRRAITEGRLPQRDAVRVEELINYFDYDYSAPRSKKNPFKPTIAVYPSPWNSGKKLMHIGIKGHEIDKHKRPQANLVFLIDVSGSMRSNDKLPLLKNSFKLMVEELNPDDTVSIAVYAGAAGVVLEPTRVRNKERILNALDRLYSGGSTAGGAGINLAYALAEENFSRNAVNRVMLATDGDFNVGTTNQNALKELIERKRDKGIYLSVLGFGKGNYNDALMQTLAQNGNGNAAYIDSLSEAKKVLIEEAGSTLFTIAKDVKIQVEFNPARVSEYRLIGYESRMLNREDFNDDRVDAGEVGAGHSVTAIYEITERGGNNQLVDDLRYGDRETKQYGLSGEYAFLKIRYKLPNSTNSKLLTTPITNKHEYSNINRAPTDIRFAASVAGFGQILKGSPNTHGFSFEDCKNLAKGSMGDDRFGYRAEFIDLLSLAGSIRH